MAASRSTRMPFTGNDPYFATKMPPQAENGLRRLLFYKRIQKMPGMTCASHSPAAKEAALATSA